MKSGALPQREMGSIKSGGAAAARIGKYEKRGAAATRIGQKKSGALPQREMGRSEEHTSELQSHSDLVCRLLLEKKKI